MSRKARSSTDPAVFKQVVVAKCRNTNVILLSLFSVIAQQKSAAQRAVVMNITRKMQKAQVESSFFLCIVVLDLVIIRHDVSSFNRYPRAAESYGISVACTWTDMCVCMFDALTKYAER